MNNQTLSFSEKDFCRIFRIMSGFVSSFETLSKVGLPKVFREPSPD